MNIVLTSGILAISIDLELDVQRRGGDQQRSLETIGRQLADLLANTACPPLGPWPIRPSRPPPTASWPRNPAHEIAILGDRTWVGPRSRSPPLRPRTDPPGHPRPDGRAGDFDAAAARHRTGQSSRPGRQTRDYGRRPSRSPPSGKWFARPGPGSSPLRFGLWQLPTQLALPCERDWRIWRSPIRQAKTELAHAVAQPAVFHLSISGLAAAEPIGLRTARSCCSTPRGLARTRPAGRRNRRLEPLAGCRARANGARPARSCSQQRRAGGRLRAES